MTLRIQRSEEPKWVLFKLTGRIQADQIPELEILFRAKLPGQDLALDLKEVKLVDREAVRFLAQREAEGTRLINCSAFIREWILQERNGRQHAEEERHEL